jgi:hypothetical protein
VIDYVLFSTTVTLALSVVWCFVIMIVHYVYEKWMGK